MWGVLALTVSLLFFVWALLVPPGYGIERWIGYQPWLHWTRRYLELREQTLMRKDPPVELLFKAHNDPKEEQWVWQEAGEALDLRGRDLRHADFYKSKLWDADLRGARLQGADLSGAELQGADLEGADLEGADLRGAVVYGTQFQDAELSLADLRGLRSLPVGWEGPRGGQWEPFSGIEALEAKLGEEGEHWTKDGRERITQAIDRFWSIAFDLPLNPTTISPRQGPDAMHDRQGLFATWPAPPDVAKFEQARAEYRAGLACDDQYIAKAMQWEIERLPF